MLILKQSYPQEGLSVRNFVRWRFGVDQWKYPLFKRFLMPLNSTVDSGYRLEKS